MFISVLSLEERSLSPFIQSWRWFSAEYLHNHATLATGWHDYLRNWPREARCIPDATAGKHYWCSWQVLGLNVRVHVFSTLLIEKRNFLAADSQVHASLWNLNITALGISCTKQVWIGEFWVTLWLLQDFSNNNCITDQAKKALQPLFVRRH